LTEECSNLALPQKERKLPERKLFWYYWQKLTVNPVQRDNQSTSVLQKWTCSHSYSYSPHHPSTIRIG